MIVQNIGSLFFVKVPAHNILSERASPAGNVDMEQVVVICFVLKRLVKCDEREKVPNTLCGVLNGLSLKCRSRAMACQRGVKVHLNARWGALQDDLLHGGDAARHIEVGSDHQHTHERIIPRKQV